MAMSKNYTIVCIAALLCIVSLCGCDNNSESDIASGISQSRLDNDNRYVNYPLRYHATKLPFSASLINNTQQVAGVTFENNLISSVVWTLSDGMKVIDSGHELTTTVPTCRVDDGYASLPFAINDNGLVLGKRDYYCSHRVEYFIWDASRGTQLIHDKLPNYFTLASGLDNRDNILGACEQSTWALPKTACIVNLASGEVTIIPILDYVNSDGVKQHSIISPAISPMGVVATNCTQMRDLCTWDAASGLASTNLSSDLSKFIFSIDDVNDHGAVIGSFFTLDSSASNTFYATTQDGYNALPRVTSSDAYQIARSINNEGKIVGYENPAHTSNFYAVLWHDSIGYDLNRLVSNQKTEFDSALDINNQGQIIAEESFGSTTYILNPY